MTTVSAGPGRAHDTRAEDVVQHFLLTKFNLPISYAQRTGQHAEATWLSDRWSLFERYCLPSVLNQLETRFTWILYCWDETPEPYRSNLEGLAARSERISTVFLPTATRGEHLADWAATHDVALGPHLLTTRLDNDDAISSDYIQRVRDAGMAYLARTSRPRQPHLLSFPVGYQLRAGRYYLRVDPKGPFVSLLESATDATPNTILSLSHRDAPSTYGTTRISVRPSWLQVLHDDNLVNRLEGIRLPVNPGARFGIGPQDAATDEGVSAVALEVARTSFRTGSHVLRSAMRRAASR